MTERKYNKAKQELEGGRKIWERKREKECVWCVCVCFNQPKEYLEKTELP